MDYLIIKAEKNLVTAARFKISGRSVSLDGAASFVCDEENPLPAIARRIAEGVGGVPRVVLCLAPSLFAQRIVELPLTDLRKVREVLPAHLLGEMVLSPEEVVFEALPASGGSYLAIWAKKTEMVQAIEIFKSAGIEPQIVTSDPFSWCLLPGISPDVVVCDGDALVVMAEGRISCMRALEAGDALAQVAAALSALELSEVALPPGMVVFGGLAETSASAHNLPLTVESLELPTELAAIFKTDAVFQQLAGLYAVASACHGGELADFRRGDLAWTAGDARQRKKLFLTAALTVLVVILLFVSKGLQYRAAQTDIASLNKSISVVYREVFPARTKVVDELAEVRGEIKKMAGADNSRGALDVFRLLAEAKGATINGLYEAELEGNALRVKGDARSSQAVSDFKSALSAVATSVELGEVKSRPDGTVTFSLSAVIRETQK